MPLSAFTLRNTSGVHSDLALGLSELEKKLCQNFQRIEIRGKRNRKVPIPLTPRHAVLNGSHDGPVVCLMKIPFSSPGLKQRLT